MTVKIPNTIEEIMLIQPNNMTFGQYHISEVQENILTLISDQIQDHITTNKKIPRDIFQQPYVEIVCDEAGGMNNKAKVKKEIAKLSEKKFQFRWLNKEIHKTVESEGVLITTYHDIKGSNKLVINFNAWAIPFMIYYGEGVGGTIFNKAVALRLRGQYTKRIYKILCSQRDRLEYYYPLGKFKEEMGIPNSYDNTKIVERILEPSKVAISESSSDVKFDYELICRKQIKGRKKKADTVLFKITSPQTRMKEEPDFLVFSYVFRWMQWVFGTSSSKAQEITDKLKDNGWINDIYKRACYYDDKLSNGNMTKMHCINSLKKMLQDEYSIK